MERLTLTARVEQEDSRFVTRIESIGIQGEGDSVQAAQEELIQAMISWISNRDCTESMAGTLVKAGFPEIDDDTEIELEFIDLTGDDPNQESARNG